MVGRDEGDRVDIEGARDAVDGLSELDGGPRNAEAAEGGGRRAVQVFDGIFTVAVVGLGREGGAAMGEAPFLSTFRLAFGVVSVGGGIIALSWVGGACDRTIGFTSEVVAAGLEICFGTEAVCAFSRSPSSIVNEGMLSCPRPLPWFPTS